MDALHFLLTHSREEIEAVCRRANTNRAYLSHIAYGHRHPSWDMCQRLECASGSVMTRAELRPDIFEPCPRCAILDTKKPKACSAA